MFNLIIIFEKKDELAKINKELKDFDEHFANVFSERKREEELEKEWNEKMNVIKLNKYKIYNKIEI